jgi:glucose-6-phosphate 1-dehydrogenase
MSAPDSPTAGPTVVIFGASGDLTRRKLIPALYNNFIKKRLPAGLHILGFARRDWGDESFRDRLGAGVKEYGTGFDESLWRDFASRIRYHQGNLEATEDFVKLQSVLNDVEKQPADGA